MVKWNATMIFSVALTKRAVGLMALRHKGISMPQGPVAGCNILCVDGVPCVLGENHKGIPFLFIHKKEKGNLIIEKPKGRWVHQTLLRP